MGGYLRETSALVREIGGQVRELEVIGVLERLAAPASLRVECRVFGRLL